jgi:hypothetical protein
VRSPTLVETTAVFAPMAGTFVPDPDQVLRLVGFKPRSGGSGRHLDFTIRPLFCSEPLRPLDSPGFS